MLDWVSAFMFLAGATFTALAALGVVRMPDLFLRMQAASKASTLGLACLLVAAAIELGDSGSVARAASIAAFVMLTTPVAAHVVARAAALTGVPLWSGTVVDERSEDHQRDASSTDRAGHTVPGEPPLSGV